MNLLLSCLLLAPPAHAEPPAPAPVPEEPGPALTYTHGARLEIEAALDTVTGWIEAARRREDLDERLCLQPKLPPMTAYAEVAGGAAIALREHLAVGDRFAAGLEVRKVSVAVDRVRLLFALAQACLLDKAPDLVLVEDPDTFRHEVDLGQVRVIDVGGCGDSDAAASPC